MNPVSPVSHPVSGEPGLPTKETRSEASASAGAISPGAVVSLRDTPAAQQLLSVHYQLAEGGRKIYYQVVDENTGEVIRQVPPSQVLSGEERLFEFLEKQNKPATAE